MSIWFKVLLKVYFIQCDHYIQVFMLQKQLMLKKWVALFCSSWNFFLILKYGRYPNSIDLALLLGMCFFLICLKPAQCTLTLYISTTSAKNVVLFTLFLSVCFSHDCEDCSNKMNVTNNLSLDWHICFKRTLLTLLMMLFSSYFIVYELPFSYILIFLCVKKKRKFFLIPFIWTIHIFRGEIILT